MENCLRKFRIFRNGFTLAEVLITLVIIGVIAAMTIPTLVNNTKQKQYIVAWRKAYSDFNRALLLIKANGDSFDDCSRGSDYLNKITKYMNAKTCGSDADYQIYTLNNGTYWRKMSSLPCFTLENSTYVAFDGPVVRFDINGSKKPNTVGKDVFFAELDTKNFTSYPAVGYTQSHGMADGKLVNPEIGDGSCQTADYGFGCSAWYLLHDK